MREQLLMNAVTVPNFLHGPMQSMKREMSDSLTTRHRKCIGAPVFLGAVRTGA